MVLNSSSKVMQHSFELEAFCVDELLWVRLAEQEPLQPHPQVPQQQRHAHKKQTQQRIAGTGANPCLAQLPVAGFDAKTLAIRLAQLRRRAPLSRNSKHEFLAPSFLGAMVAVALVRYADTKRHFLATPAVGVLVPAGRLAQKSPQPRMRF